MFSLEARRKRFGKRWRRKNLVRKLLKRKPVTSHSVGHDGLVIVMMFTY